MIIFPKIYHFPPLKMYKKDRCKKIMLWNIVKIQ